MMNEADILALTYNNTMKAYREGKVRDNTTGITKNESTILYEDVQCALSKAKRGATGENGVLENNLAYILFTRPEVDLKVGDIAEVYGLNDGKYTIDGVIKYISHNEFNVTWENYK